MVNIQKTNESVDSTELAVNIHLPEGSIPMDTMIFRAMKYKSTGVRRNQQLSNEFSRSFSVLVSKTEKEVFPAEKLELTSQYPPEAESY